MCSHWKRWYCSSFLNKSLLERSANHLFESLEVKSNESGQIDGAEESETEVTSIPRECSMPNVSPHRNAAMMRELLYEDFIHNMYYIQTIYLY